MATLFVLLMTFSITAYLVLFVLMVTELKKGEPEYWKAIGSPSFHDPTGQAVLIWKVLFGRDITPAARQRIRKKLIATRILLIVGLTVVVVATVIAIQQV